MRILYAALGYKPAYRLGGPVQTLEATAERLVKRGHEVIVFTTNSNLDEDLDVSTNQPIYINGVQVWYFSRKEPFKKLFPFIPYLSKSVGFLYSPLMKKYLDIIVPTVDIVHIQMPFIYPTYAAGCAAIRYKKPLFYHQHGVFSSTHLKFRAIKKKIYIKFFEIKLMKKSTFLIALTRDELETYRRIGIKTPCCILPNGVDIEQFPQFHLNSKSSFGISHDELVILFMARLHPTKGADRLIRAFLMIHKKFPNSKLVMAGPDEWGLVDKFRQEIMNSGAFNNVIFPGMVTGQKKKELLNRANLFCLPSEAEGFSMAVLEALAHSTAVLISPDCHFPEVEKAGAGRISKSDPITLSSALSSLLIEPESLKEMGRVGRSFVSKHYSWDKITDQLIDVYIEGIDQYRFKLKKNRY